MLLRREQQLREGTMIKKIIYLTQIYFEEHEYSKYGCDIMEKNKFNVEIWNMVPFFYKKAQKPDHICEMDNIVNVENYQEFICKILKESRKNTIFLLLFPVRRLEANKIEMVIKLFGYRYCMTYLQPLISRHTMVKWESPLLEHNTIEKVFDFLFPPTYNFLATKVNYLDYSSKYRIRKKNNILIHTLDYDKYLMEKEKEAIMDSKYIVFIDEFYPFHRDAELLNECKPVRNEELYFERLNKLFRQVEEKYECEVIIALHPRAFYKKDYFDRRKRYVGQTSNLIKNAYLIITHNSTAIDYIILYNKPFLLICTTSMMQVPSWKEEFEPVAAFFKAKVLNINEDINDIEEYICKNKEHTYQKYLRRYIKCKNTPEQLFFEVVANTLKNYNKNK